MARVSSKRRTSKRASGLKKRRGGYGSGDNQFATITLTFPANEDEGGKQPEVTNSDSSKISLEHNIDIDEGELFRLYKSGDRSMETALKEKEDDENPLEFSVSVSEPSEEDEDDEEDPFADDYGSSTMYTLVLQQSELSKLPIGKDGDKDVELDFEVKDEECDVPPDMPCAGPGPGMMGGRRRRRRSSKRGAGKRRSTRRRSSKRRGGKAPVSKGGKRKARKTRKSRR
jgi:hypothetical protein